MRYVLARFDQYDRDEAYRIYVTRSLQLAPRGESMVKTYYELLTPEKDTRTGEEIVMDIMTGAGLKFGG